MSASLPTSRLARFAILTATGVTALSLAACGSSNTSSPTTSPSSPSTAVASPTTTSSAPAPNGETRVSGLIASVAGNAAQVTQQNGNATVDFAGSTKVTETGPAALTDVTAGSCVSVRPAGSGQGGQPITAASVRVSPAVDGKCPQANGHLGSGQRVQGSGRFCRGQHHQHHEHRRQRQHHPDSRDGERQDQIQQAGRRRHPGDQRGQMLDGQGDPGRWRRAAGDDDRSATGPRRQMRR